MKKLKTSDLFAALRIVKSAEMRDALKPIVRKANSGKEDLEGIGIEAILTLIECAAEKKAESAIYEFLSSPFEMSAEDVAELALADLIEKLKELATENDLSSFFVQLSDLMSMK